MLVQDKARKTVSEINPTQANVNPLFDAISAVFTALIQLLRDKCNTKPAQVVTKFTRPTLRTRLQVRRAANEALTTDELHRYLGRVEDHVFETLGDTTMREIETMYVEVPPMSQNVASPAAPSPEDLAAPMSKVAE